MRWLKYLSIFLLIPFMAYALRGPRETLRQFIEIKGDRNLLINPGFESGRQDWNLATDASTFSILNTSTIVGSGLRSFSLTSNGFNEYVESDLYTISKGIAGRACVAIIDYNWSTGTVGGLQLMVLDHADTELVVQDITPNDGFVSRAAGFTCPSEGSIKLRVHRNSAIAGVFTPIHLDSMYLGKNESTSSQNRVISPRTEGVRLCSAQLDNDTTPTIPRGDNGCVASGANTGTGNNIWTFATGTFSDIPQCLCSPSANAENDYSCKVSVQSASAVRIRTSDAGSAVNLGAMLRCSTSP